ncbi:hypothetical protein SPSIL_039530 [Sporomusa silvacetica DSM 10669]|uniref:Uncharacterized protein n=2 Tax=Sporomusa silvacetica TaxID=55504 RepID=A0ABZ3IPV1_9FIRM|nr:hypothetical protein SPSIL_51860 [Sporomusa silvacetica DSM 10669]
MICMILSSGLLGIDSAVCLANENTYRLYPEELWIELDVTTEQRKQIDAIIKTAAISVLKNHEKIKNTNINMLDMLKHESLVNDRRINANEKISQLLTVEQQSIFDSQLRKQEESKDLITMYLLSLDLTEEQQPVVLYSLIESQKQVWSIISDEKLSWEARRKKIKQVNAIDKLYRLLTETQKVKLKSWSDLLSRFKREEL